MPRVDLDEGALSVVVRTGDFRCAVEARSVERMVPFTSFEPADAAHGLMSLAVLLGLGDPGASEVVVQLRGHVPALVVAEVEGVQDMKGCRFHSLPALTRLERPAFRGVWELPDSRLLPALDVRGVFAGYGGQDAG